MVSPRVRRRVQVFGGEKLHDTSYVTAVSKRDNVQYHHQEKGRFALACLSRLNVTFKHY